MKISPEAFYRICDIEYQQTVTTSDFKKEVDKHDLGISEQNINRLITIFDEDHEGNITLQEYYNALDCYFCRGEQLSPFG